MQGQRNGLVVRNLGVLATVAELADAQDLGSCGLPP